MPESLKPLEDQAAVVRRLSAEIERLQFELKVKTHEPAIGVVVRRAFERALIAGGPGLSEIARLAIINNAMHFIRHELKMLPPSIEKAQ